MRLLLVPLLALLGGCLVSTGGGDEGGTTGELVPAAVEELEVPALVLPGEEAVVVMRGHHPDRCTRFDRLETRTNGSLVELEALSWRPIGPCAEELGEAFEVRHTLSALPPGIYEVVVNAVLRRPLVVAMQVGAPAFCADTARAAIQEVLLPPATWSGGSAVLGVELVLPSWCHVLDPPRVTRGAGRLAVELTAGSCGRSEDASMCPEGPQAARVEVELGPELAEGTWVVEVNGASAGTFEVVPVSRCSLHPLEVRAVSAASPVALDAPPTVRFSGVLRASCAALDPLGVVLEEGAVVIDASVHECGAACVPKDRPVARSVPLPQLSPGTYAVTVNGRAPAGALEVLPSGACTRIPIPDAFLDGALVTSLGGGEVAPSAPLDVMLYGSLGDACWREASVAGHLEGQTLVLSPTVLFCETVCTAGQIPFLAGWSLPAGLEAGTWTVRAGTRDLAVFEVR